METLIGKLKAKLQLLELTHEKTEGIISTGITEKIRRHKEALQSIVIGAEEIKREVEQAKLEGGEALDKVKEWGKEFELKIDVADTEITLLEKRVKRMVADAENEERETKETLLARQREEQLKFERQQLEQKEEFEKEKVASPSKQNVKLWDCKTRLSEIRTLCTRSSLNSLKAVQRDGKKLRSLGKVAIPPCLIIRPEALSALPH